MDLPSFRTYLRVIFHRPAWMWVGPILGIAGGLFAIWVSDGTRSALIAVAAGCLFIAGAFPWWRRRVSTKPEAYTWGRPELLGKDRRTSD